MSTGVVRGLDLMAVAAAVIAGAMLLVYVQVTHQQGDQPQVWVVLWLALGAVGAAYGIRATASSRRPVLLFAGASLLLLGLLAILSIGLPLLVAGALALVAGRRRTADLLPS